MNGCLQPIGQGLGVAQDPVGSRGNAPAGLGGSAPGKFFDLHLETCERLSCRCKKFAQNTRDIIR